MIGRTVIPVLLVAWSVPTTGAEVASVTLVPRPEKMELHDGTFRLTPETTIRVTAETHRMN